MEKVIKIGIFEDNFSFDNKLLKNPTDMHISQSITHGDYVVKVMYEEKIIPLLKKYPDAKFELYALPRNADGFQKAIELDLDIINLSWTHSGIAERMWEFYSKKQNIFLVAAAGNDGENNEEYAASHDHWLAVGALGLNGERTYYSSYGLGAVMCMMQGDWDFDGDGELDIRGTSFAAPALVGELAFYLWHYKNTHDRKSTINETLDFIINNCVDLENDGKDIYTGFGKFELPELDVSEKDYEGHWAEKYIDYLINEGLVEGYSDGTIKPDMNVTRAELFKLVALQQEKINELNKLINNS